MKNLKNIVIKKLNELAARQAQSYAINNQTKADELIDLYNQTQKFKWIGNVIQIIKGADENGILLADLLDKLSRDFRQNKTSQEINPPLGRLVDSGILRRGRNVISTEEELD
jgi:tetrahydrodipicolinate N-succinyltransferase